jgi:hypothetical protein
MNIYTTSRAIAILDKVGWPTGLQHTGFRPSKVRQDVQVPIIRDHLRAVLEKKGMAIKFVCEGQYALWATWEGDDNECLGLFASYDEALLAGCTQEEK